MHQVFTYGCDWCVILDAVRIDPSCILVLVLAADYFIATEDIPNANACIKYAKAMIKRYPEYKDREKQYVSAWGSWLSGDAKAAFNHMSALSQAYPSDLFILKRGQLLAFILGDVKSMLTIVNTPAVIYACRGKKYYHGMLSFALEQNCRFEEAAAEGIFLLVTVGIILTLSLMWMITHLFAFCFCFCFCILYFVFCILRFVLLIVSTMSL
jgi:hypothetical protein